MVESGKITLSSQFVQLPDTPTNFHRPSTSRSTKLAKSLNPSPRLPQRERIQYGSVNQVSRTFAYTIHQASSRFFHSKCFKRFSPPTPPMSKFLVEIWNKSSWDMNSFWLSNFIKIQSPIHKIKISQFLRFPRIPVSPSNSPNVTGSGPN